MTNRKSAETAPLLAGLRCRCPNCAGGRLFVSYLKLAPRCPACGYDFSKADAGDGPAVFVILFVGFAVTFAALLVEVKYAPPYWLHAALWLPLMLGLALGLLQPVKGLLVAIQFHHDTEEARIDPDKTDPQP